MTFTGSLTRPTASATLCFVNASRVGLSLLSVILDLISSMTSPMMKLAISSMANGTRAANGPGIASGYLLVRDGGREKRSELDVKRDFENEDRCDRRSRVNGIDSNFSTCNDHSQSLSRLLWYRLAAKRVLRERMHDVKGCRVSPHIGKLRVMHC